MGRSVSIKDIALIAGVSHTTVSRALRGNPHISPEVKNHILQLADEMGYIPNALAQGLRGSFTNTIGLVVTTIADPFVGNLVRGIGEYAEKYHMSIFLSESKNDPDREMSVIEMFHRRRVDALIIAATRLETQYEKRIIRVNVPTVLINQQSETELGDLHSISIDDYSGARQAVQHLIDLGHRSIAYLGAGNRPRSNQKRFRAYCDALENAGIPFNGNLVRTAPPDRRYHSDDIDDGQTLLTTLLKEKITAVFCFNDMFAIGALMACRLLGISVPDQISIVGFDDIEMARYLTPALTTIHQPKVQLGQLSVSMVMDLLNSRPVTDSILPTDLKLRRSTTPFPG